MKKVLSLILVLILLFSFAGSAFASSSSSEWNKGEKINFNPLKYHKEFKSSAWTKDLVDKYGLSWYEDPTRYVYKGEAMFAQLRTIQATLERRGLRLLSANGETLTNFKDTKTLVASALEEAKVLKAVGLLTKNSNSYMYLDKYITRGEVATVLAVVNRNVLGITEYKAAPQFTDISYNSNKSDIIHAYKIGLINGLNALMFYPDNVITLEQLFALLNNQVGYYGITHEDVAKAMNETFKVTYNLNPVRVTPEFDAYSMRVNMDTNIKVNVYPEAKKEVVFLSLDESVCKVRYVNQLNNTAVVRGYKTGSTYIKVYVKDEPNYYTIIPVHVTDNNITTTGVSINEKINVEIGNHYYLTAVVHPYNATNKTVSYSSSNVNIAAVDWSGKVTGIREGTAVITVKTHNGYTASTIVTVTKKTVTKVPVTGITITNNVNLEAGFAQTLNTVIYPNNATDKTVIYYSDDSGIARVNSAGRITAVKEGTTIVTAETSNGYKAYCVVTVLKPTIQASGITMDSNVNINIGETYYLSANVLPYNAANKTITFVSDNTSIVRVNSNGLVTGISKGTAVITAITHNGYMAHCVVKVGENIIPATGVSFIDNEMKLEVAESNYVTASVSPYSATNRNVKYYSDDNSIAVVNSNGKVTGIKPGVAVITAETHNNHKAYCIVTVVKKYVPPAENKGRSFMYVNGYGESSYYNAFGDESMNFIVETDLRITEIELSNNYCYITKNVTKHSKGWEFTVKSSTLKEDSETVLLVTLSDGQILRVRICIYK